VVKDNLVSSQTSDRDKWWFKI